MVKYIFVLVTLSLVCSAINANDNQRIREAYGFTFYGLDFSNTALVGVPSDFQDLEKITTSYFTQMNQLILDENEKYNIAKYFKKTSVNYQLEKGIENSKTNTADKILVTPEYVYSMPDEAIPEIVSHYKNDTVDDIGMIIIVEALNKKRVRTQVIVTFFDVNSGDLLFAKRLHGECGGFGFRNYWMNGIYSVLKKWKSGQNQWLRN